MVGLVSRPCERGKDAAPRETDGTGNFPGHAKKSQEPLLGTPNHSHPGSRTYWQTRTAKTQIMLFERFNLTPRATMTVLVECTSPKLQHARRLSTVGTSKTEEKNPVITSSEYVYKVDFLSRPLGWFRGD